MCIRDRIKSSDGFYVVGSVSELMLDDFKEGTKLNCTSYTSGSFEADVMDCLLYTSPTRSSSRELVRWIFHFSFLSLPVLTSCMLQSVSALSLIHI